MILPARPGAGGLSLRTPLVVLVLLLATATATAAAPAEPEPACVEPRDDGRCTVRLDPDDETDPVSYRVGGARPQRDECQYQETEDELGEPACHNPYDLFVISVCTPSAVIPVLDVDGGTGVPRAYAAVWGEWSCVHMGCAHPGDGAPEAWCGSYVGSTRAPYAEAEIVDSDGDGRGDTLRAPGLP